MLAVPDSSIFLTPKFNQFLNSVGSALEIYLSGSCLQILVCLRFPGDLVKTLVVEVIDMFSTLVVVMVSKVYAYVQT